ncbi:MAG TPA: helix-turn-helix domain-containing protein [Spirochaetota bacterium]|nr:helix-turn-helix domain-containing protein [Spirochaetota bacterium]HPJ36732.1 helix-turn-helix domain-containing protein [Spirochaetota bacterium]
MNRFDRNIELCDGLETDFIKVLYYEFPEYYRDIYRSYEYYRVCTIIEGNKHVEVDNMESFVYDKDQFIVLPPESTVSMEIATPTRALVLEISDRLIDDISSRVCLDLDIGKAPLENDEQPIFRRNSDFIKEELGKITLTALANRNNKEFLIDLYVQEMTYKLLNCMGSHMIMQGRTDNPIGKAIDIMKSSVDKDVDITGIARSLGMSPPQFSTKFKKITGLAPNLYFTHIKLNEARKMLKNKSVTEVSLDLGYDNISHFIRLFNDKFGITPKQFQMQMNKGGLL